MDIIGKRKIFFVISGIFIAIGIVSLVINGLKLSIDFTGGSRIEVSSESLEFTNDKVKNIVEESGVEVESIRKTPEGTIIIRTKPIDESKKEELIEDLGGEFGAVEERSFETLGPTIGKETRNKALTALVIAIIAITLYIAIVFRHVSKPVSSWKYGVSAIVALLHDVLVVFGAFSLFGYFFGVEIDALFVTAILTIMGFSVHDSIVVFDRIRENLIRNIKKLPFDVVVNNSVNETLARSLNTSITLIFVLFALILFGGESIRWFIVAFMIGVAVGTYSSIFIASPLLVVWSNWDKRRKKIKKVFP